MADQLWHPFVRISDVKGTIVSRAEYSVTPDVLQCNVGTLSAGVYIISLEDKGEVINTTRFVKE